MMFWIVIVLAFLFFVGLVSVLVFIADAVFGGEDFSTSSLATKKIIELIKIRHLENGQLLDLGSCRGKFAVSLAKALPDLHIRGVDNDFFRIGCAKIRSVFLKNLVFSKENLLNSNLSAVDITYIYLPKGMMPLLERKLKKEMKPGSLAISNRVSFPNWQPKETYDLQTRGKITNKLFIYQV